MKTFLVFFVVFVVVGIWIWTDLCGYRRLTAKNVKIARPTLFNYIYTKEETDYYVNMLWDLMIKEKFDVRIHKVYPLEEAAKAQDVRDFLSLLSYLKSCAADFRDQDIESRGTTGKLLLKP